MRKYFVIGLILSAALMMASCGAGTKEAFVRNTVPDLILIPLDDDVEVAGWTCRVSGNYLWDWPSGKNEYTRADAIGPSATDQMTDEDGLHILIVKPLNEVAVKLEWQDRQPDSVELYGCWSTEVFGRDPEQSEDDYALDTRITSGKDGERILTLTPGAVYDIYATWQPAKGRSYGDAHFYFIIDQNADEEA